jgi:hypothetical protein
MWKMREPDSCNAYILGVFITNSAPDRVQCVARVRATCLPRPLCWEYLGSLRAEDMRSFLHKHARHPSGTSSFIG